MKKSLIAISMTILIVVSLMAPLLSTVEVKADTASWYTSVNGVLSTDAYSLYPYAKKSVTVGFSKFGELIGLPEGVDPDTAAQTDWVGLAYDGRDPFCPASIIPMTSWVNGLYMDLQYIDPALSGVQRDRHLWAFAMFGDGFGWGGDWASAVTPGSNPGHGRQTNGQCVTEDLKVLYDGPRKYIAMSVTHIYDKQGTATWPVVDLAITVVFDKVNKQVVLFKDVKLKLPKMHLWGKLDVQLSNREEFDLGPANGYASYAHFYPSYDTTPYDANWHMATDLLRENVEIQTADGDSVFTLAPPGGADIASDFMKVWVDGVFRDPSTYTVNYGAGTVTLNAPVGTPDVPVDVEFHYKFELLRGQDGGIMPWGYYDLAQVISSDGDYVAWTGMWPPVSDYTVDGILRYMDPLVLVNEADCDVEPKQSPLIIGEWDFLMDHTLVPQYRCVEVKGITDNHDGNDVQYGQADVVDSEALYQLGSVFNPWDLYDAMEKQEYSYIDISAAVGDEDAYVQLTTGIDDDLYYAVLASELLALDYPAAGWTGYFVKEGGATALTVDSTWVNEFASLPGSDVAHSKNWALLLNSSSNNAGGSDGYEMLKVTPQDTTGAFMAPLTLQLKDLVDFGFWYKFVGTTGYGPHIEIKVSSTAAGGEAGNWANIVAENSNPEKSTTDWTNYTLNNIEDFVGEPSADTAFFVTGQSGTGLTVGEKHSYEYFTSKLGDYYVNSIGVQTQGGAIAYVDDLSVAYLDRLSGIRYERVYNMEEDKLIPSDWNGYCTFAERVLVDGVLIDRAGYQTFDFATFTFEPYYTIDFATGLITFYEFDFGTFGYIPWEIEEDARIKVLYHVIEENDRGRYEWAVVGRNAATIDSAGAALVTAAFKNKDIEIGLAGADIDTSEVANQMPFVMSKWGGTGDTWAAYYKSGTDYRTALKDDWCTQWAVADSNMIGVGGPLANMVSYYGNDFADAFYGITQFAGTAYDDKVTGIPCWNRGWNGTMNAYTSGTIIGEGFFTATAGYAVVSTYKDLNGTVQFLIWGHWGRDTYYATKWFHEGGKTQLQEAPPGLTSIILQISYSMFDPTHPSVSIIECLGTISERLWLHGDFPFQESKGGIHDP